MKLTIQDIKHSELLKSTPLGDIFAIETLGGLHLLFLKKKSGETEILSSSTSSLRTAALANRKRPDLEIPVIVKSQEKNGKQPVLKDMPEGKEKLKSEKTSKEKLDKILADKIKNKGMDDEVTRKVNTLATQKAIKRNKIKIGTGGYGKTKQYVPPASEEVTRKVKYKKEK